MTTGIVPNVKYFESINAIVPGMDELLEEKINNKEFDYIVVTKFKGCSSMTKAIPNNYDLISTDKEKYEDMKIRYYLYERKGM